jgi:hypothetical protein
MDGPERKVVALESPRATIRRYAGSIRLAHVVGFIVAVAMVVAWLIALAASSPALRPLSDLGLLVLALLLLAALVLSFLLVPSWIFPLLSRSSRALVTVGRSVTFERSWGAEAVPSPEIVSAELAAHPPNLAVLRTEEGDVLRFVIDRESAFPGIVNALAGAGARGPWHARLFDSELPRRRVRLTQNIVSPLAPILLSLRGDTVTIVTSFFAAGGLYALTSALRSVDVARYVTVGSDGVALRRGPERRFIPFSAIERVEPRPYGADLVLTSGERVDLAVAPPSLVAAKSPRVAEQRLAKARRDHLLARLEAGLVPGERVTGEDRLARHGKSVAEWREAMRALVRDDGAGYRAAQVPIEHAARVLENGRAEPEARIGAALALSAHEDPALKKRVRIAIEACADDETKLALTQALEDRLDPQMIERAERMVMKR